MGTSMQGCLDTVLKAAEDTYEKCSHATRRVLTGIENTCCRSIISKTRTRSALLVGLDNAGKTSVLCCLPPVRDKLHRWMVANDVEELFTAPTTSMQLVTFKQARSSQHRCHRRAIVSWRIWDCSGQGRYRSLWMSYCSQVQAVIFVVDVTDVDRVAIARRELHTLYAHPALALPLLILANKCDGSTATPLKPPEGGAKAPLNAEAVKAALNLETLQLHLRLDLKVIETSAESGKGVETAFQWFTDKVRW
ncbi:Arf-like GTPase [Aureococcus anophagefferens]|nr:Arf-like GTPase [Aureococcus anophagefferens]